MNKIFGIYEDLLSLYIETLRKHKRLRNAMVIILTLILLVSISLLVFRQDIFPPDKVGNAKNGTIAAIIFSSAFLILSLLSYSNYTFKDIDSIFDIEGLRKEREEIKERIQKQENNVLDTIQLSLNQLQEYYTVNLNQAKSSYRWSITVIIAGFITLITGVWMFYFQKNANITLTIISGISGVLLEFIGAANIYIYNKSIKQLNTYFSELIKIQDTMLAIELCEGLEDEPKKLIIKEKIILTLMGRSSVVPEKRKKASDKKSR